ncbi:MAG: class I SAM-dependent methyltransferase [Solirubrobacterales bacterium]
MENELRGNDPGYWGHSLANLAELMFPLLDAAGTRSVLEIGSYEGDLTRELLRWSSRSGGSVAAIEPKPPDLLLELAREHPELELIRETSHEALPRIEIPDTVIVDGDHNYYTVREELRLIEERTAAEGLPLLLFHDVGWPHGRRDTFYSPDQIPDQYLESVAPGGHVFPGDPGLADGGLPYRWVSEREGGPRNGVLTAVEEFVSGRDDVRLAIVPAFFGLGVVWERDRPWAGAVAEILDEWDRNPIIARLEANRVLQLATEHVRRAEVSTLRERTEKQERLLRGLLGSRMFALADRLAGLPHRGGSRSWRQQASDALGDDGSLTRARREH